MKLDDFVKALSKHHDMLTTQLKLNNLATTVKIAVINEKCEISNIIKGIEKYKKSFDLADGKW